MGDKWALLAILIYLGIGLILAPVFMIIMLTKPRVLGSTSDYGALFIVILLLWPIIFAALVRDIF